MEATMNSSATAARSTRMDQTDTPNSSEMTEPPMVPQEGAVGISITTAATTAATTTTTTAGSRTMTLTEQDDLAQQEDDDEILMLSLRARPSVRWDESVLDNEGLGRKTSKRCCIFHKQRGFGESSTDSSDYDSDKSGSSTASGSAGGDGDDGDKKPRHNKRHGKIARPKSKDTVPDSQRFHA